MGFQSPSLLLGMLILPALILAYVWAQRRRQRYALRYSSLTLLREALGRGPGRRRHVPPALFIIGLAAMVVSLAGPYATLALPRQEGTVILAIDVSGSMAATDLEPNRMEAAKAAAKAFVKRQPKSIRIGVVSFSDNAFLVQPPTEARETALAAIEELQPQSGTAIGLGMLTALDAIDKALLNDSAASDAAGQPSQASQEFAPAIIVLLSDGESNRGPRPLDTAKAAAEQRVRVHTVGIGSPEGAIVRVQGRAARTRLDEETLQAIAQATSGTYYTAESEKDLVDIYKSLDTHLVVKTEQVEMAPFVIGLAIGLSVAGSALSLLWFNRFP